MSAHTREIVLIAAVALYFVTTFLLLWLNRDHDEADPDCGCAFCRRERTSVTRLGLRVVDFVSANPGLTLEEIARGVQARTAAVRKVLMSEGFSWSLRLLHPSDRAKVYRVVSVEREGRGTVASGPSEGALEAAVLAAGQLAAEGKTIDEIREQLGVSLRTAWRYLASAEIRPAPRPRDYETEVWERSVRLVIARSTRMTRFGYVAIYLPMHPNSNVRGEVLEHRLVMERQLGRFLRPDELVHHINEVRTDNRPENLQIVSIAEHQRIHADRQLGPTLGFSPRSASSAVSPPPRRFTGSSGR